MTRKEIESLGFEYDISEMKDSYLLDYYYLHRGNEVLMLKYCKIRGIARILEKTGINSSNVIYFDECKTIDKLKEIIK